jgi:hypothetical protein
MTEEYAEILAKGKDEAHRIEDVIYCLQCFAVPNLRSRDWQRHAEVFYGEWERPGVESRPFDCRRWCLSLGNFSGPSIHHFDTPQATPPSRRAMRARRGKRRGRLVEPMIQVQGRSTVFTTSGHRTLRVRQIGSAPPGRYRLRPHPREKCLPSVVSRSVEGRETDQNRVLSGKVSERAKSIRYRYRSWWRGGGAGCLSCSRRYWRGSRA